MSERPNTAPAPTSRRRGRPAPGAYSATGRRSRRRSVWLPFIGLLLLLGLIAGLVWGLL